MAYDFNSSFSASGIQVTTLTTTYPSHPSGYPVSTTSLDAKGTAQHTSVSVTSLEDSGVYRREYDPYGDFNFVVEIDGLSAGAFQKCDGLSFEVDLLEYQHGMDPYPRKRRGNIKWGNIKLTKGYTTNSALWDWAAEVMQGGMARRTGAIHLLGDDGNTSSVIKTFKWINGFPVKWSGFKFDGKGQGGLVEEIEIAVEEVMVG